MPPPVVISAAPLPNPVRISIANPAQVRQYFDRIRIYRSADIDGPFVEITTALTRLPIEATRFVYEYVDAGGVATDYYRVTYWNSVSGIESAPSEAQLASGDPALEVISVDDLKRNFLFGIPLVDSYGQPLPDSFFEFYIKSAVTYIERRLDIPLRPETIVNELHDYKWQDYKSFIYLRLRRTPIRTIDEIRMVLPPRSGADAPSLITFDSDWIQLQDPMAGNVNIFPGTGQTTIVALSFAQIYQPLLLGAWRYLPNVFHVDYTAGFPTGRIPTDIQEIVGMQAALGPLGVIGDTIFGAGIAGNAVTLDALMTNVRTTKDSENSAFSARIREYRKQIEERIKFIRRSYKGIQMAVV